MDIISKCSKDIKTLYNAHGKVLASFMMVNGVWEILMISVVSIVFALRMLG